MDEGALPTVAVLRATEVGDTLRMTMERASLRAEVRDRVSPVLPEGAGNADGSRLEGFVKDAGGEWDLDSVIGAKQSPTVEIVVRRIASNIS